MEDLKKEESGSVKFQCPIHKKSKEMRSVVVTRGLKDVPVNNIKARVGKGKRGLRHTGDSNYLYSKDGILYHQAAKVVNNVAHKAGITNW